MQTTDWKQKAMQRSRDNKRLNKRIKELTMSRDEWKMKTIQHKAHADKLANDLKKIKDRLNDIVQ
jgi:hypothetical protein